MKLRSIVQRMKRYARDDGGNLTMILSLAALPLIAAAGLAVDMARIVEARSAAQNAADGAALAAAIAEGTDEQREAVGLAYANANLAKLHGVSTSASVQVNGDDVDVTVNTIVEGTLLAVAFPKRSSHTEGESQANENLALPTGAFDVSSGAAAEDGETYYRCLIALNPSMENAIYIRDTGNFTADECAVHADSNHASSALHRQGNATATAVKFTSVGGWKNTGAAGSYSVEPKGNQDVVGDPINMAVSDPGGSASTVTIKQNGNVSLSATKYSNITIQAQGTATFTPGVHYITGTLSMGSQATLTANNVTLVLLGNNAKIDMGSGSVLKLQAPTGGAFPGYAVVGDKSATSVQVNSVQGGAGSYIRGAWYTPKHKFYVTGGGDFNFDSSYFPVIADNIEIGGNGEFYAGFDWSAYSYPEPVKLLRSENGKARLTE